MSDFDEKLPQDGAGEDLDGLSLDDLLRSAKEELARADRLIDEPPQETAGTPEDAPETFQPRSRNEYAAPEQPVAEDDEQEHTHRARLSAPLHREVAAVMAKNKAERHLRGGEATKRRYAKTEA